MFVDPTKYVLYSLKSLLNAPTTIFYQEQHQTIFPYSCYAYSVSIKQDYSVSVLYNVSIVRLIIQY